VVTKGLFGRKPEGNRDQWSHQQQQEIAVTEWVVSGEISAGAEGHTEILNSAKQGTKVAKEIIKDEQAKGWWNSLW